MQLQRFNTIQEFCDRAQDYLLQHEAEHNLLLGILHTLRHYPDRYPEPPYLAIVEADHQVLAIAIRTPPHKLVLSKAMDFDALQLIAQDIQDYGEPIPGVSGLVAEVATFLPAWQTLTGQSSRKVMDMRIHQLTQVQSVATAQGHLRLATDGDRPLLFQWFTAFNAEIDLISDDEIERRVEVELKRQSIYLWEDSVPVSMVGGRQFSATAARIAPVYTPPEYRRKGYATAGVAALSQMLLEQGCDRCFLFTDLANPTSNHIYKQIGYRPVCDWHDYSFIEDQL
jgi:uncharacterized protein